MSKGPSQVLPFLFLGSVMDGRNTEQLKGIGVSRVLNVSDSARFVDDPEFQIRHIPISDFGDTKLLDIFGKCFDVISAAKAENRKILVHCRHGQNRSPAVILAYLVERERMSLKEAYAIVTSARPKIAVHESYFEQLQALENTCSGQVTLQQGEIGPSVQQLIRELRRESQDKE